MRYNNTNLKLTIQPIYFIGIMNIKRAAIIYYTFYLPV